MAPKPPFEHPDDWPIVRLSDITTKIGSGATPTGGQEAYLATRQRYALVRSQNVFDRRFDAAGLAFISDNQAVRLAGVTLQRGDLLLNITGDGVTFGRACEVPSDVLPACINQHVAIVRLDRNKADPRYVLAFLTHPLVKPYIEAFNSGGSRRAITKAHIESFLIPVPPLEEQAAIGAILGALDDKIDLNRRMNETLEAMARAIFQDWFVTFGPTRAKQEGRPPYLASDLWSLFPNRLDADGKPEGWARGNLGDYMLNFDSKRVPVSSGERAKRQGAYPYHGATGVMDYVDSYLFDGTYLLIGEDGSVVKDTGLAFTQYVWGKLWVNNHAHVLQGRGAVSTEQLLLYFQHEQVAPYVTGAVQMKLSQGRMNSMPFLFAGETICRAFSRLVESLFARLRANADESKTLAATRDLLLPKLMSGELRVKGAEREIEAVT
jgi:type I restriction enzyme S subunit